MFLSHIDVPLSLSLSLSPCLPPSLKINKHVLSGGFKKKATGALSTDKQLKKK